MIELLFLLFGIGAKIKEDISESAYEGQQAAKAIRERKDYYYDGRGRLHYLSSAGDKVCFSMTNKDGHECYYDHKTHQLLKDVTQEKLNQAEILFQQEFKKAKEKAIQEGKKYFEVPFIRLPEHHVGNYKPINFDGRTHGYRYRVDNEKAYVKEDDDYGNYYLVYYQVNKSTPAKFIGLERVTKEEYREY